KPSVNPKPGMTLGCLNRHPACAGAVVMEFWIVPSYSARLRRRSPFAGFFGTTEPHWAGL
ncbi:hypothetical protein, partial [Mesorhizobium sp. LNHC221B00]|uniref:hypothetical protein n=1 Tax=Mesorhizobium sp. LNHC221B00 TaxID=1287233 RepID=UPI001AEC7989